jgi:hypothetical protein
MCQESKLHRRSPRQQTRPRGAAALARVRSLQSWCERLLGNGHRLMPGKLTAAELAAAPTAVGHGGVGPAKFPVTAREKSPIHHDRVGTMVLALGSEGRPLAAEILALQGREDVSRSRRALAAFLMSQRSRHAELCPELLGQRGGLLKTMAWVGPKRADRTGCAETGRRVEPRRPAGAHPQGRRHGLDVISHCVDRPWGVGEGSKRAVGARL